MFSVQDEVAEVFQVHPGLRAAVRADLLAPARVVLHLADHDLPRYLVATVLPVFLIDDELPGKISSLHS